MAKEKKEQVSEQDFDGFPEVTESVATEKTVECGVDFEKQNNELTECYKRLAAEYDNYRKRTSKEKEEIYDLGVAETIEKLLPVLDNLDLAIKNSKTAGDEVTKGIMLIHKQFTEILERLNVYEIDCIDKPFDPNLHDAVMTEQNEDKSGMVIDVFKKGYIYKERVIRHSMVKVAN